MSETGGAWAELGHLNQALGWILTLSARVLGLFQIPECRPTPPSQC